jgi:hypothetical protein
MAAPSAASQYPWVQGTVQTGVEAIGSPVIVAGYLQKQGGIRSFQPAITAPGTIASSGTVFNSTGLDCNVYMSATVGITSVKILAYNGGVATSYSPPGSIAPGQTVDFQVPGPGAIEVTYTGALSWTWVPV